MIVIVDNGSAMRRLTSVLLLALLLATAGCSATPPGNSKVNIVAGFYPLQFVADRVGGERVQVTNLVQPGAEPHDLELNPGQVAAIADADLVVYLHGFQPAVDDAVVQDSTSAFEVARLVPQLGAPALVGPPDPNGEEETAERDPHIWLDPTRLATVTTAVAERLAQVDPDGAADYQAQARQLSDELSQLDKTFFEGLRQCQRREIVVSHAAFGYLAERYGLRQIPITGLSPETEPTPQHMAAVADEARRLGATTIFFETLVSPRVAKAVASHVGAQTAVLDPIEGLEPGSAGDYLSVMRTNLATLRTALGCM